MYNNDNCTAINLKQIRVSTTRKANSMYVHSKIEVES